MLLFIGIFQRFALPHIILLQNASIYCTLYTVQAVGEPLDVFHRGSNTIITEVREIFILLT